MNPQGDDEVRVAHHGGAHHAQAGHGDAAPVPVYTPLTAEQNDILAQHQAWLDANRQTGGGRKRGVLWDGWNKRDLRGRDLRYVDARNADLRKSNLAGAQLDFGNFRDADLSNADFTDASVEGADFTAAVLKWAKLSQARGLGTDSLGAADLSFCELPDSMKEFPALKSVEDLSSYLQGLYKIILTLCAVGVFTMLSFRDEQILEHHQAATAPIPIIGAAVSPAMFAAFVPIVILLFQVYFAIYVISLWTELSHLPAFFPDGTPLDRRAYQTLFNTFVRLHFNLLVERVSDWISAIVSTFLSFYIPPVAIVCFWIGYLRRHDLGITDLEAAVLAFSCLVAGVMTIIARPQIRNEWSEWWPYSVGSSLFLGAVAAAASVLLASVVNAQHRPAMWLALTVVWIALIVVLGVLVPCRGTARSFRRARPILIMIVMTVFLPIGGALFSMAGPIFASKNDHILVADVFESSKNNIVAMEHYAQGRKHHWIDRVCHWLGVEPFLDVAAKTISTKPEGWTDDPDKVDVLLDSVVGADLENEDLRSIDANRAFLVRANLHHARLDYANLRNANLRGADLRRANLEGAILRNADLRDAWMWHTRVTGALLGGDDPFEPNEEGRVNLQGARLEGVECEPYEYLRRSRNFALAYYGVRNGREILRMREETSFGEPKSLLADNAYDSALAGLRNYPDRENVDGEYLAALQRYLSSSAATDAERTGCRFFTGLVEKFVKRNEQNIVKLGQLGLGYRTDEQLLLGQLPGYQFDDLNLREADMRKFELRGAKFARAILRGALFDDADLRGVDFTNADLSGASLKRAKIDKAVFTGARLGGANLVGAIPAELPMLNDDQKRSAVTSPAK
jgi:uncharacterized protein YjbI with pentapeptide repeats